MKIVKFNTDTYMLPSCWDEMSTKDLLTLSRIIITSKDRYGILLKLALSIMGMRVALRYSIPINNTPHYFIRQGFRKIYLVSSSQMAVVAHHLDFLFEDNTISPNLKINPFPELRLSHIRRLAGPADGLTNITLAEFITAEIEREAWENRKSSDHMHRFLAVLWRPFSMCHPEGDPRAPLNQDTIHNRSKQISRLKPETKQLMVWFYMGCLSFLQKKFDKVFHAADQENNTSSFDAFMNLVNLLAREDLSKFEKVRESPLYDALYNLQRIMEDFEKKKRSSSYTKKETLLHIHRPDEHGRDNGKPANSQPAMPYCRG